MRHYVVASPSLAIILQQVWFVNGFTPIVSFPPRKTQRRHRSKKLEFYAYWKVQYSQKSSIRRKKGNTDRPEAHSFHELYKEAADEKDRTSPRFLFVHFNRPIRLRDV
jgi:hypothetical protein